MTDERKVSESYRELPREEPPPALDDAILAASRRAVQARPAPLVAPTGRKRWTFPLAAAAVIVLAVAVTVHVERERPDAEVMSGPVVTEAKPKEKLAMQDSAPKPIARRAPPSAEPAAAPEPKPEAKADAAPERRNEVQPQAPVAAAPAPAQEAVGGVRGLESADMTAKAERRAEVQSAPSAAAASPSLRSAPDVAKGGIDREGLREFMKQAVAPEQLLQGIADLRRQGRHEEAEKALTDFRKRFPKYRIPEALLQK